jgi:hypothetical protein
MIWESSYWKDDLLRSARNLRAKTKQANWPERSQVVVQKLIFLGFYSIRKLLEAGKLSTKLSSHNISVTVYPPTGEPVTRMNWHHTDRLFDFSNPSKSSITLPFLADQVIHSYVFQLVFSTRNRLRFILICSDRQRKKGLLEISIRDIIQLFETVGRDYPATLRATFNPTKSDYDFHQE